MSGARSDALPDLDECAREPIHIPGAIQPHGMLLVVDAADGRVLQASANAEAFLGRPLDRVLGAHWSDLVDCAAPTAESPRHVADIPARLRTGSSGRYSATWHLYETRWQLEVERIAASGDSNHRIVHELMRGVDDDPDVERAAARIARGVRQLLGYDRVMVYRFDPDWHGEVVAEAVRADLEPYLGLHYPATDIPAQARALYLRNRVRTIGDIRYVPSPLVPTLDPQTQAPTDLSDVTLRSVSPVHIEYLDNMGVRATLVASIITNDRLWGLIACHHYEPMYPPPELREQADLLARALAGRVGSLDRMRAAAYEIRFETIREHLISHFAELPGMTPDELQRFSPELLEAVDADGVVLLSEGVVARHGATPDDASLLELRRRIVNEDGGRLRRDVAGVLYTDAIAEAFPDLAPIADLCAGVLYIPLDARSRSAILWTRVEQSRTVRWGGNPYLAKLQVIAGARLSPRQSFSAWQEEVRGRSLPWTPSNLESARALRVLVEVMDRKHFQAGVGVLHATLDVMNQPMVVVRTHVDGGAPDIVHVNQAFKRATGLDDAAEILATWRFADAEAHQRFVDAQHFRVKPRDRGQERRTIELQPLGIEDDRRHWLGLLERVPV